MTKEEYLGKLDKMEDFINVVAERIFEPNDILKVCWLKFEMLKEVYNCSKED